MKLTITPLGFLAALLVGACSLLGAEGGKASLSSEAAAEHGRGHDGDEEVPLDRIPAVVLNAALVAVPGLVVEEAEMEVEDGVTVYDLEGTAAGEEVSVEVTSDGQVLEVEKRDEEGEHENGEEDEEDRD